MPIVASRTIDLEGVRVHNLKGIDLRLPLHKFIVISGVSGSGKSSLAFDTLYAEGRRRYIESFSAYARQFLDRLEKPDADRIENVPPAIAIRQNSVNLSSKSTVATATELHDYLRLLFAKVGQIVCPGCKQPVGHDSADEALARVHSFDEGTRFQIAFPIELGNMEPAEARELSLRFVDDGFARAIVGDRTIELADLSSENSDAFDKVDELWIVVDRLVAGKADDPRVLDSLELAFREGNERSVLIEDDAQAKGNATPGNTTDERCIVDEHSWRIHRFNARLVCEECDIEFIEPEPRLFSFNVPLGACPSCSGFGSVPVISFDRLVPDPTKTLAEGAIAAWTTPAYRHELDELLELAGEYKIPFDVPFNKLKPKHLKIITEGVPKRNFGGLKGFFAWLERNRYKISVRVFLIRWRAYEECKACNGSRLQPASLAVRIDGKNIADICSETVEAATHFFDHLVERISGSYSKPAQTIVSEIRARLEYLKSVGLEYLALDRRIRTLSGGEARRIALTAALGSSLVNTMYVLDEPSAGLHMIDSNRVIDAVKRLRDVGNTVIVVEHEDAFVKAADELIDVGPGAGREGGRIVFQGLPEQVVDIEESVTGAYLSGRIATSARRHRRPRNQGSLTLIGARQHNLKKLRVEFPLGVLCVVTGVSGSGKSTLVEQTLLPAVCSKLGLPSPVDDVGSYDELTGTQHIDDVVMVDTRPIGRTPRSNPVTYMKVFDEIRRIFAETAESKLRNFTAKDFSFNTEQGGRCRKCKGRGSIEIDMHFLADVSMTCPECTGARYRPEILQAKHRGLSISEVLDLTVHEAFTFFRNRRTLQKRLKFLKDVGLDYLPLGQPATTLSGGESQRLKLASFLASSGKTRTLFLIDEPTTGLHAADVSRLLACFDSLLGVGHSLVVIEHNLDVIAAADYLIDLGPEAGDNGGTVVATGTPEEVCTVEASITGRFLRDHLNQRRE